MPEATAQLCDEPAMIPSAPVMVATATGLGRFVFVPSPSWPAALPPQHSTVPSVSRAQLCDEPAAMLLAVVVRPLTATGVGLLVVEPLPS